MTSQTIPIIDAKEVADLAIDILEFKSALEKALVSGRQRKIVWRPKESIACPDGTWLVGTFGCWSEKGVSIFHNISGTTAAPGHTGPHYRSYQLLTNYHDGGPLALVDGSITSTILPACVTLLSATRLARPNSSAVTFVGAGAQARINLEALRRVFPISHVRIASRTLASADTFASFVRKRWGLKATSHENYRDAIEPADIVITSVPIGPGLPMLDPAWVTPGTFVSAVDLGRSWHDGFGVFDRVVTDDMVQAATQLRDGRVTHTLDYDTELPALVTGERPGRQSDADRVVIIHPGNLVGVLALTTLIYERWSNKTTTA